MWLNEKRESHQLVWSGNCSSAHDDAVWCLASAHPGGLAMITALLMALATQASWTASRPADGWQLVGRSQDAIYFIQPGPGSDLFWRRVEIRESRLGSMSFVSLVEIDCIRRRARDLQGTAFSGPNQTGTVTSIPERPWTYVGRRAMSGWFLGAACAGPADTTGNFD